MSLQMEPKYTDTACGECSTQKPYHTRDCSRYTTGGSMRPEYIEENIFRSRLAALTKNGSPREIRDYIQMFRFAENREKSPKP